MSDVYNLGNVGATLKVLYNGKLIGLNATTPLTDSIKNYTLLLVRCGMYTSSSSDETNSVYIPIYVNNIKYTDNEFLYCASIESSRRILFSFTDDKNIKITLYESPTGVSITISEVIGVLL